ncbi:hypothetical protein BGZ73_007236 [Actinomortierella ambigua]|nr:hypothetical protein BGZ73_007236 [Actinomortierella ambigua]
MQIPNRVNYVCWIEDLIGLQRENVVGIDISIEYATKNVARNNLQDRISIVKNLDADKTLPLDLFPDPSQSYDFCMCNPPFFESDDDYLESLGFKLDAPAAALSATDNELTTPGGEVQFVKKMIDESKELQKRVRWYTSMLGKKSSVNSITAYLRECSILNFTVATFRQGRTFRWAVAWSHHLEHAPKGKNPRRAKAKQMQAQAQDPSASSASIVAEYSSQEPVLGFELEVRATDPLLARENSAKKQRVNASHPPVEWDKVATVEVSWLVGKDRELFESFVKHLRSRLEGAK